MILALCGYQGCGKSTVGEAYSKKYDVSFVDTDRKICEKIFLEKNVKCTVREVFQLLGEKKFRDLEKEVVKSLCCDEKAIVATGGGVLIDPDNVRQLKSMAKIVYLKVDSSILYERMMQQDTLPKFIREAFIEEDFQKYINSRKELYESSADVILDISDKTIAQCVGLLNQYRCDYGQ